MQQIGPSCKCIYIPTPSACGENPFLMPWTGRKPCLHFSALSSASGLMGCTCCFPQQSSASCFGAGRVREQNSPLLVVPPHAVSWHTMGQRDQASPLVAPLPGQPFQQHRGQQRRWEKEGMGPFGGILLFSEQMLTSFLLNFLHISVTSSVHHSEGMNYKLYLTIS